VARKKKIFSRLQSQALGLLQDFGESEINQCKRARSAFHTTQNVSTTDSSIYLHHLRTINARCASSVRQRHRDYDVRWPVCLFTRRQMRYYSFIWLSHHSEVWTEAVVEFNFHCTRSTPGCHSVCVQVTISINSYSFMCFWVYVTVQQGSHWITR